MFIDERIVVVGCLLLAAATASANTFAEPCGREIPPRVVKKHQIQLLRGVATPEYYAKVGNYALLVSSEDLDAHLSQRIQRWHSPVDEELLKRYRDNFASGRPMDLYAPALEGVQYFLRINFLLAELIESGQVRLVDFRRIGGKADVSIEQITMLRIEGRGAPFVGRDFCGPDGSSMLLVVDEIID
ncbi:MAG TPA: hypothetical protein VMF52_09235 [Steroidobacteraceae bacterium]|nr:hypothetical protein [Steroidobacteraceae bacterium]